jgi:pyridoxine 5'-phosphate synthase PdxJ
MAVKQDGVSPRTASDLERKYQFGKTFSEMLGLIDDTRKDVDSVESTLRNEITEQATTLSRSTGEIVMTATEQIRTEMGDSISGVNETISELNRKVEMKLDANAVSIVVKEELAQGVDQVQTESGYRFDKDGLTISKTGEEMSNVLDNTGMYVKRAGDNILTANNNGVEAVNLHASTYLIIGSGNGRSRIEDYGTDRTGVFWIGG